MQYSLKKKRTKTKMRVHAKGSLSIIRGEMDKAAAVDPCPFFLIFSSATARNEDDEREPLI